MAGIGRGQRAGNLERYSPAKAGSSVHVALLFDEPEVDEAQLLGDAAG
jgi:hypothetical protein